MDKSISVTLEPLSMAHVEELMAFEKNNRTYFERSVPPRSEDYFIPERFMEIMQNLVDEQEQGLCRMYIIRDEMGELVGRINLFDIVDVNAYEASHTIKKAEVGYRVGEAHTGKGIATKALKLVLEEAFMKHGIEVVEAGTSPSNIGSQIALLKNGFEFVERVKNAVKVGDAWHDGLLFARTMS